VQKVLIVVQTIEVICTLRFRRKEMGKTSKKAGGLPMLNTWTPICKWTEYYWTYVLDRRKSATGKMVGSWCAHLKYGIRMQVTQVSRGRVTLMEKGRRFFWNGTNEQFKKEFMLIEPARSEHGFKQEEL
jgi:hypothetical protein